MHPSVDHDVLCWIVLLALKCKLLRTMVISYPSKEPKIVLLRNYEFFCWHLDNTLVCPNSLCKRLKMFFGLHLTMFVTKLLLMTICSPRSVSSLPIALVRLFASPMYSKGRYFSLWANTQILCKLIRLVTMIVFWFIPSVQGYITTNFLYNHYSELIASLKKHWAVSIDWWIECSIIGSGPIDLLVKLNSQQNIDFLYVLVTNNSLNKYLSIQVIAAGCVY